MNLNKSCKQIVKCLVYIVLSFVLFSNALFSQVKLAGTISDSNGPVFLSNVVLYDTDGKFVSGTTTDDTGAFVLNAPAGKYKLSISYIGYEDWEKELELEKDLKLDNINLVADEKFLDEVVVATKRQIITRKTDRLVFNVEDNVLATGGDAIDVLKVSPGVAVSNNQINLLGKSNMRVMIDGRMIELGGDELVSFLMSIPANDIKEVEIITNPPAKYEVEGNSGLINIIYKKAQNDSWSNAIGLTYFQAKYGRFALRNNFSYKKNKVNLLVSLNSMLGDLYVKRESEIFYPQGFWDINRNERWDTENLSGRFMLDYDLNNMSTIGFQYLGNFSSPDPFQTTDATADIFDIENKLSLVQNSYGASVVDKSNHSFNGFFKTMFDTLGNSMEVNVDYFVYNADDVRDVTANAFDKEDVFVDKIFSNNNTSNQKIDNYSMKIDFTNPLPKMNLSYGAKASFNKSRYLTNNYNTIGETPILNENFSDDFEYDENVQAVYVNASKPLSKKLNAQVGLRMEYTQTKGVSNKTNETNTNNYLRPFPTLYLAYNHSEKSNFSFSYGRRINRPFYYQLNPARTYITNYNYLSGNPQLQPSYIDNFELSFVRNQALVTTLFWSRETDGFEELWTVDESVNEQYSIFQNFFTHDNIGLSQFYTASPFPWWGSQNGVYIIYNHSSFDFDEEVDISAVVQNGFRYYFSTNNSFTLNKSNTIRGEVNFWYSSAYKKNFQEFGESYNLDVALNFSLIKNTLQLAVGAYDIFNSSPTKNTFYTNGVKQTQIAYWSPRHFRATLSYNFGSNTVNVRERGFSNDEEKRRAN